MKTIIWQDKKGFQHRSLLRDGDDERHPERGLPADPPDVKAIDWNAVALRLNSELVARGLWTWDDVQRQQSGLSGAILTALRPAMQEMYRQQAAEAREAEMSRKAEARQEKPE